MQGEDFSYKLCRGSLSLTDGLALKVWWQPALSLPNALQLL